MAAGLDDQCEKQNCCAHEREERQRGSTYSQWHARCHETKTNAVHESTQKEGAAQHVKGRLGD